MTVYYNFPTDNTDHDGWIGWDKALNTYFLHVVDETLAEDDENRDITWVGTTRSEILNLDVLLSKAKAHGNVDEELRAKLSWHPHV